MTPTNNNPTSQPSRHVENVCTICSKGFDRLYNLKVHMRKHTGETPYQCPMQNCFKQFKWRSSMAHHVRAHHNGTSKDIANAKICTSASANFKRQYATVQKRRPGYGVEKGRKAYNNNNNNKLKDRKGEQSDKHDESEGATGGSVECGDVLDELLGKTIGMEGDQVVLEFERQLKYGDTDACWSDSSELFMDMMCNNLCRDPMQLFEEGHVDPVDGAGLFSADVPADALAADVALGASHSDLIAEPLFDADLVAG